MVFSSGVIGRDELHAHGLGLLGEVVQDPLAVALLEVILPLVGVLLPVGEHGVDQAGQLVGSGRDGLGFVHARAHATVVRAQRRLARTQGRCRQPQRLGRAVGAALGFAAHDLAPGDLGARTQTQPGGEVLVTGELAHVSAHLGDHHQRGGHVDAVDAGEVHAAHLKELGAQIELRGIASAPALLAFGRFVFAHMQSLQLRLNLRVALSQLGATEVKRSTQT